MKDKKKSRDQHASGLLIRFPESARVTLDALREKYGTPYTVAALRALADFAAKHGVPGPVQESGK